MSSAKAWPKTGWLITFLASAMFIMSATMKIIQAPQVLQMMTHLGWQQDQLPLLATLELGSVILYLISPVSVLGGIVLTGFLGGAIATHVRIGEPVYMHIVIGILIWTGLALREPRLRELIPFRK